MERTITVAGKTFILKASALTPRLYRTEFGRDLLVDISAAISGKAVGGSSPTVEIFENIAYIMAKQADKSIGSITEWLDRLEANAIYELIPVVIDLWVANESTTAEAKKNEK